MWPQRSVLRPYVDRIRRDTSLRIFQTHILYILCSYSMSMSTQYPAMSSCIGSRACLSLPPQLSVTSICMYTQAHRRRVCCLLWTVCCRRHIRLRYWCGYYENNRLSFLVLSSHSQPVGMCVWLRVCIVTNKLRNLLCRWRCQAKFNHYKLNNYWWLS